MKNRVLWSGRVRDEKFCLWMAESYSMWRGSSWAFAIFWIAVVIFLSPDVPMVFEILAAVSLCKVVYGEVCHSLLRMMRRAGLGRKSPMGQYLAANPGSTVSPE